ncbi:MAG: hypothetical protein IT461_05725, partial [Planctomycetes bacterium]|nr:hypothetical protein [Planctomycetota bacterium]
PPIMKLAGRLATAGLRMAIKGMGKLAGMASKAWNAAGRGLRAANGAKSLLTKAGSAAKNLRHLDALKSLREHAGVIYERTNVRTGAKYIGKAKNWNRFLARRAEHARKTRQIYSFRIIDRKPGGRLLSLAEEEWMRRYGGPCSYGGPLENRFAAMNDLEYVLSGGDVPWP